MALAESLIGTLAVKYKYGHPELGQSPADGFDCTGFVRFVLLQSGLVIPDYIDINGQTRPIRHSNEFWDHFGIMVHPELGQAGDMIFMSRDGCRPSHVGIMRDDANYIHSPGKDGARVVSSKIFEAPIISVGDSKQRQTFSKNPIGYKSPTIPCPRNTYRYNQISL